jgi:hypothetical protein
VAAAARGGTRRRAAAASALAAAATFLQLFLSTALSYPAMAGPGPGLEVPVTYYKLPNGLKVVLSPDKSAPTIGVGVYYNIGSGWTQVSISPLSTGNWVVSIDKSNMIVGSTSYTGGVYYNFGSDWIQAETYPVSAYNWFVSISGNNLIVGSISLDNDGGIYTLSVTQPCLLPFTKVKLFDNEYISVQNLSQGDIVKSPFSDKPQMIKQILKNSVSFDPTSKNMPICIPKSFLSQNVPSEDVYISGHHRIIIQTGENNYTGIQAFKLTDRFLTQEELQNKFGDELVYYHIELEDPTEHLIVSDMFVESYQKNV